MDIGNFRIVAKSSQKETRDAIIAEQDRKLVVLAKDIIEHGLNPCDQPIVVDAEDGNGNYVVMEGNRRLTAIQLMVSPELAEGTSLHAAFKKLHKDHADAIPKVIDCVITDKKTARTWIRRKHSNGLHGAGTEPWVSMAKARSDVLEGLPRPDLDAVNFVLTAPDLDSKVRSALENSRFNISTLQRLVEAKDVQEAVGFTLRDGKLVSDQDKERIKGILKDVVTIISKGRQRNGEKFTERNVDTEDRRRDFFEKLLPSHPRPKKAAPWTISGNPVPAKLRNKPGSKKIRATPSTEDRTTLIPRDFKLALPSGKINDVFVELRRLNVGQFPHAVSVLFRVFLELTFVDYIKKHAVELPKGDGGHVVDSLSVRLDYILRHVKNTHLLNDDERKPLRVLRGSKDVILAPDTLNAYVHSEHMNAEPLQLKRAWNSVQLFIERLWTSKATNP